MSGAGLIPKLPGSAWAILGGDCLSSFGSGMTLPFLLVYLHQVRRLSYAEAGLALAVVALVALVGNPVGGSLADRFDPRKALAVGLVLAAAGSAALTLVRGVPAADGACALLGMGTAIAWPAQDALLAGLVPAEVRSRAFAVRYATMNAGLGAGALAASLIVTVTHPATFVAIYLIDGVTYLAYLPVVLRLAVPRTETGVDEAAAPAWRDVFRDRSLVKVWLLAAALVAVSFGQYHSGFPGFVTRAGGVTPRALSLAFAANTIAVVFAQLIVLRRLAGHRRTTGIATAATAFAACWAIVLIGSWLGGGPAAAITLAIGMIVFAVGECALSPTLSPIVNDLAPEGSAGRYNGLLALGFTTGFIIGPATAGSALDAGAGGTLFALLIPACLALALVAARLGRSLPPALNLVAAEPIAV